MLSWFQGSYPVGGGHSAVYVDVVQVGTRGPYDERCETSGRLRVTIGHVEQAVRRVIRAHHHRVREHRSRGRRLDPVSISDRNPGAAIEGALDARPLLQLAHARSMDLAEAQDRHPRAGSHENTLRFSLVGSASRSRRKRFTVKGHRWLRLSRGAVPLWRFLRVEVSPPGVDAPRTS